jgi:glycosyltransferase involved in cell wall biosynthesis
MRIGFATFENFDNRPYNSIGSTRIRARWLMKHWPEAEEYKIGRKYDVIIFQKVYWKNMMEAFEGIKILDLCDPDWLEGKPVVEYANLADAVVTSSQALADYIKQFLPKKKVVCIPDRVELSEYPYLKKEHNEQLKEVVWFGYSQNFRYVQMAFDALMRRNMNLTCLTDRVVEVPAGYVGMTVKSETYRQETIAQDLAKFDLVLLPDPKEIDERGKFKSDNKTLQSWAVGMPVARIESDLDRLLTKEAREKEGKEKRELIEKEYNVTKSVEEYKKLIKEIREEWSLTKVK